IRHKQQVLLYQSAQIEIIDSSISNAATMPITESKKNVQLNNNETSYSSNSSTKFKKTNTEKKFESLIEESHEEDSSSFDEEDFSSLDDELETLIDIEEV
ncbi:622_t:CDS:2, partial [Racocetra fulgida]